MVEGIAVMYGIIAQPVDDAAYDGETRVKDALARNSIDGSVLDVTVTGDPVMDDSLSVEVEVVFPELPDDLEAIFPEAEGITRISVTSVE